MTDLTLIIGNKNYSSWSLRPWIFMRHFGLEFHEKRVSLFVETTVSELSPYFSDYKVPVLQDGDLTVWDSLAILEYLSERHLDGRGWPGEVTARAVARSVSAEMHSSFPNLRGELPMNCRKQFSGIALSAKAQREVDRVMQVWRKCRTEYGVDGDWLFGEFSAADAMYAPVALRFAGYDIALDDVGSAYVQTVLKHPAIKEWIDAGKQETEVIAMDEIEQ